jgi:hypothetical protein
VWRSRRVGGHLIKSAGTIAVRLAPRQVVGRQSPDPKLVQAAQVSFEALVRTLMACLILRAASSHRK